MQDQLPERSLQLTSTLNSGGQLLLELSDVRVRPLGPEEVLIQVESAPINPSDLLVLLPGVAPDKIRFEGTAERPRAVADLSPELAQRFCSRFELALVPGLEGAGIVIAAGETAQHLVGRRIAAITSRGGMYCQYRTLAAAECVPLPENVSSSEGSALFCNPMTAVAIIETLHQEGFDALVHTAGASNLGQMLVRACREDGIPLVAVVRRQEQVDLLRALGAEHVCDSSAPGFDEALIEALTVTGARVAFDAIGGGDMAHRLLQAMEKAAMARQREFNPYGSSEYKQVYIYGRLNPTLPKVDPSGYGMVWGVGGWAMPPVLTRAGSERAAALQQRVLDNIKTTFASSFLREISLAQVLQPDMMLDYCRKATGGKYLINPTL